MSLIFKVKVLTPEADIIDEIMSAFAVKMNTVLVNARGSVLDRIQDKIEELILASPEVDALINGTLGQELGLVDPGASVAEIIVALKSSIQFNVQTVGYVGTTFTSGGYDIGILRSDFTDALSISTASYVTSNGQSIPWLSWLLTAGDTPVIYGWRIDFNPNAGGTSRTGPIMVCDPGGSWGVPSQYAGTIDDNFLTRALSSISGDIDDIIQQEIGRLI